MTETLGDKPTADALQGTQRHLECSKQAAPDAQSWGNKGSDSNQLWLQAKTNSCNLQSMGFPSFQVSDQSLTFFTAERQDVNAAERTTHDTNAKADKQDGAPKRAQPQALDQAIPVGRPWDKITNELPGVSDLESMARHSIVFGSTNMFHLRWNNQEWHGLSTGFDGEAESRQMHTDLQHLNKNIKVLAELRYRDASPKDYLPENHPWWMRDPSKSGDNRVDGYPDQHNNPYKMLDFTNPAFQDRIAAQAKAAVQSGGVDGIMFDWFNDGRFMGKHVDAQGKLVDYDAARLQLLQKVRRAIGDDKLILINTNDVQMPQSVTNLVNGYYMECTNPDGKNPDGTKARQDWRRIENTLDYAEKNTRSPHINIVQTWFDENQDANDLSKMRATVGLVLTHAPDGYALIAENNGPHMEEHRHRWFDFYNTKLGKVDGEMLRRPDGSTTREYENGTVLYNPAYNGEPARIDFPEPRYSVKDKVWSKTFEVKPRDADIFLRAD